MRTERDELYFEAEPRTFERLTLADLPAPLLRKLCALHAPDDRYAARFLVHVAMLVAGAWLALASTATALRASAAALETLAMVGLSVGLHEASHRRLLRRRWANDAAGLFFGVPLLIPVSAFRTNHRDHHWRRGCGREATPEVFDFALLRSLPVYLLGVTAKSFGFVTVLPAIALGKARGWVRWRTTAEYLVVGGALWLAARLLGTALLMRVWLLPLALTALVSQVRAVAEHGLTLKGSTFTASRTVLSNRLVSFLMCNINYHLEHHLCPAMPWYRLPEAHRLLAGVYRRTGASVYPSYRRFYADFVSATWHGIRVNARLVAAPARAAQ